MKHFLEENNFNKEQIETVFKQAFEFKNTRKQRPTKDLFGQNWGMLFYKNSTRTRVSFEVGIRELGGNPSYLIFRVLKLAGGKVLKIQQKYYHVF